jgi:hypothetical protein
MDSHIYEMWFTMEGYRSISKEDRKLDTIGSGLHVIIKIQHIYCSLSNGQN